MTTGPETEELMPDNDVMRHSHDRRGETKDRSTDDRRPLLLWITVGVIVLLSAGVGYWFATQDDAAASVDASAGPAAIAEVVRETIADTRSFSGMLGFGEAVTVATTGQGVVTRLADQGFEVVVGTELFRLDERPVVAMVGEIPMYRDLELGDTGADVAQLIANLTQLGFADCDAEDEFTGCVAAAVEDWQAERGVTASGTVAQQDVVFVPEVARVDTLHARVGQVVSPGTPVLDLTGSLQVVSLDVAVRDRGLLAADTQVTVQLPGGDEVAGTVTAANVVQSEGGDGAEHSVARVEVTLVEMVDESLLGGPADVVVELGERENVLIVPVNALVALAEGGHGLEVVADDGTTSIVAVDTGLFAGGRVEVAAGGLEEGTIVVVAGR